MKKQVLTSPVQAVPIVMSADARGTKYYGVLRFNSRARAFITREKFCTGHFVIRTLANLTSGNGWGEVYADSLIELINLAVERRLTVFEFDTVAELIEWVLQGE